MNVAAWAQARDSTESFHAWYYMVEARRLHMPGISHLAISCLLILCSSCHSLESRKSSKIEHEETSNLMTHVARQFHSNVSTEREVLPLQIPRKCFAILTLQYLFLECWCGDCIRKEFAHLVVECRMLWVCGTVCWLTACPEKASSGCSSTTRSICSKLGTVIWVARRRYCWPTWSAQWRCLRISLVTHRKLKCGATTIASRHSMSCRWRRVMRWPLALRERWRAGSSPTFVAWWCCTTQGAITLTQMLPH